MLVNIYLQTTLYRVFISLSALGRECQW